MPRTKKDSILKPAGNITSDVKEKLKKDILKKIQDGQSAVVIDFSKVEIIDSTGVGVLVSACNSLKEKGGSLSIQKASADIQQMFKIMRLDRHINFS